MPSGKKPMARKPRKELKPCTKGYRGIKKKMTDRILNSLIRAEIKGRDNCPLHALIYALVLLKLTYYFTSLGILKNKITAPISKTLKLIIPDGIGPSKLLFVDNDIQLPTSPIISVAP